VPHPSTCSAWKKDLTALNVGTKIGHTPGALINVYITEFLSSKETISYGLRRSCRDAVLPSSVPATPSLSSAQSIAPAVSLKIERSELFDELYN
jgi:hypothetical protein